MSRDGYSLLGDDTMDFFAANNVNTGKEIRNTSCAEYEDQKREEHTYTSQQYTKDSNYSGYRDNYRDDSRGFRDDARSYRDRDDSRGYRDDSRDYDYRSYRDDNYRDEYKVSTIKQEPGRRYLANGELADDFKGETFESLSVTTRSGTYNNIPVEYENIPTEAVKYHVTRKNKKNETWSRSFPVMLDGLMDPREYHTVVCKVNEIAQGIMSKWCYSDPFIGSMFVTGVFVLVPYIPAIALTVKREKKIRKHVTAYLQEVNRGYSAKGYRWAIEEPLYLSVNFEKPHTIPVHQRMMLVSHSGRAHGTGSN